MPRHNDPRGLLKQLTRERMKLFKRKQLVCDCGGSPDYVHGEGEIAALCKRCGKKLGSSKELPLTHSDFQ